jgi:predicted esterase
MAKLCAMIERQSIEPTSGFRFIEFLKPETTLSCPVLIYLHGSGERGDDVSLVKRYGLPLLLARSEVSVNCSVLCPQLEAGAHWEADRVARFVEAVVTKTQKTALVGYSLGASGVCEAVSRYGPLADVAVAIAGQAPRKAEATQRGTKFFAIQGELDTWPCTSSFVDSVNASGGEAQSVTLHGKGHYISEDALFHQNLRSVLRYAGVEIEVQEIRKP